MSLRTLRCALPCGPLAAGHHAAVVRWTPLALAWRQALVGCPGRLRLQPGCGAYRCFEPPEGVLRLAVGDRCLPLSRPLEPCRTPLMGFVSKIAPPSTSIACVHSWLATVPAWQGVQRTGHALASALASTTAPASLRAFGPGMPIRCSFRPCRFSRLRRLAPHARCRSVAPCSRPWGSPGCRRLAGPFSAWSVGSVRALRRAPPSWTAPGCWQVRPRTLLSLAGSSPELRTEARGAFESGDRGPLHRWSDGRSSTVTASGPGWSVVPWPDRGPVSGWQAAGSRGCAGTRSPWSLLALDTRAPVAGPPWACSTLRPEGTPSPSQRPPGRSPGVAPSALRGCRAEALLIEVGAVCHSTRSSAPFPQARSPFEAFPSHTAAPRHRGRCPLDVSGAASTCRCAVSSALARLLVAPRPQGLAP